MFSLKSVKTFAVLVQNSSSHSFKCACNRFIYKVTFFSFDNLYIYFFFIGFAL